MQAENMDDPKSGVPMLHEIVHGFADEIYEQDEVLLSKYTFSLQDRVLTLEEAKSFLAFVRTQLQDM